MWESDDLSALHICGTKGQTVCAVLVRGTVGTVPASYKSAVYGTIKCSYTACLIGSYSYVTKVRHGPDQRVHTEMHRMSRGRITAASFNSEKLIFIFYFFGAKQKQRQQQDCLIHVRIIGSRRRRRNNTTTSQIYTATTATTNNSNNNNKRRA
jgi:hypothetical protein